MPTPALPFHPDALLAHRAFVGALARSLVRDEATAEDVVQETWLTSLTRPPRSEDSLRPWLARVTRSKALDTLRGEDRRTQRERSAARAEADESDEHLRERVALEHRVVAAVLALREPYRSTILLRYYEGLTPAEIAKRRGAPAGTVRAQLTRALQLLRQELEGEFGGDRSACSVALLEIARRWELGAQSKLVSAAVLQYAIVGLVASAVVAIPIALWVQAQRASTPAVAANPPSASAMVAESSASEAPAPPMESAEPSARESVAEQDPLRQDVVARYDLASRSIPELHDLVGSIQRVLRERWLTVPARIAAKQGALLRLPDTGVARILERMRIEPFFESGFVGIRGGGAFFSFATGSNDFNLEPTLSLVKRRYSTGFYGGQTGIVLGLGHLRLEDLSTVESPPSGLTEDQLALWKVMWAEVKTTESSVELTFARRAHDPSVGDSNRASVGSTYLVRNVSPGEHDILAAFTCLEQDAFGDTIAWRLLRRWKVPGEVGPGPFSKPASASPASTAVESEAWLSALDDKELVAIVGACRALGTELLLAVPRSVSESFRGCSVARLLRGNTCERLVEKRGSGSYYSFATQDHSYDSEPDIKLYDGRFSTGFYGRSFGAIADLGEVPLPDIPGDAEIPAGLDIAQRFLWSVQPSKPDPMRPQESWVSEDDFQRAHELRLGSASAVVGHTYLLRAALPGEHDLIAAFTVVSEDDYGVFLAWRILREWEK